MRHSASEFAKRHRLTSKVSTASISILVALGLAACFNNPAVGPAENQQAASQFDQPSQGPKQNSEGQWYVRCGLPEGVPRAEQEVANEFNNERLGHREGVLFTKLHRGSDDEAFVLQEQWVMSDGIGWWKLIWTRVDLDMETLDNWSWMIDSPFLEQPAIVRGYENEGEVSNVMRQIRGLMPASDQLVCDDRA